jgi:hypothetical protein
MDSKKYIGMDVHKESISIAVRNAAGKIVMECMIETKVSMILQFIDGLRGDLHVTFEEGTWGAWLYDLLKPHVRKLLVCDPRKTRTAPSPAIGKAISLVAQKTFTSRRWWSGIRVLLP